MRSANHAGECDVSPKGDAPGFVRILGDTQLAIPDRRGDARADTMLHILANQQVGLIFLIPGMTETLCVNGVATLYTDPDLLESLAMRGKHPQVAIVVETRYMARRLLVRTGGQPPRGAILRAISTLVHVGISGDGALGRREPMVEADTRGVAVDVLLARLAVRGDILASGQAAHQ